MKIELTEPERHFLLLLLGNDKEQRLHKFQARNVDKNELYQKVLLAQAEPVPTYWVEEWVPYEGSNNQAYEGNAEEVANWLRKKPKHHLYDFTVHKTSDEYEASEFIKKFDKGEL